jgi:hypothetical protein
MFPWTGNRRWKRNSCKEGPLFLICISESLWADSLSMNIIIFITAYLSIDRESFYTGMTDGPLYDCLPFYARGSFHEREVNMFSL